MVIPQSTGISGCLLASYNGLMTRRSIFGSWSSACAGGCPPGNSFDPLCLPLLFRYYRSQYSGAEVQRGVEISVHFVAAFWIDAFEDADAGVQFLRFFSSAFGAGLRAWVPSRSENDFRAGLFGFVFDKPDEFVESGILECAILLSLNAFGQGIVGFQSSQSFHADGFGGSDAFGFVSAN